MIGEKVSFDTIVKIMINDKEELWKLCEKFIKDQTIRCPETIYQTDYVIDHAYSFVEQICELVGYAKEENA